MIKSINQYPVTITVVVLTLIAATSPELSKALQLDFDAVSQGNWLLLLTGHITHWSISHLAWDLGMFAALSAVCERRHRRLYGPALVVSLVSISAAVGFSRPELATYRGLSGIDTGLFVWFIIDQIRSSLRDHDLVITAGATVAMLGLLGKLVFEWQSGQTLFVDSDSFIPIVESHLAGAACGLVFASAGFFKTNAIRLAKTATT